MRAFDLRIPFLPALFSHSVWLRTSRHCSQSMGFVLGVVIGRWEASQKMAAFERLGEEAKNLVAPCLATVLLS